MKIEKGKWYKMECPTSNRTAIFTPIHKPINHKGGVVSVRSRVVSRATQSKTGFGHTCDIEEDRALVCKNSVGRDYSCIPTNSLEVSWAKHCLKTGLKTHISDFLQDEDHKVQYERGLESKQGFPITGFCKSPSKKVLEFLTEHYNDSTIIEKVSNHNVAWGEHNAWVVKGQVSSKPTYTSHYLKGIIDYEKHYKLPNWKVPSAISKMSEKKQDNPFPVNEIEKALKEVKAENTSKPYTEDIHDYGITTPTTHSDFHACNLTSANSNNLHVFLEDMYSSPKKTAEKTQSPLISKASRGGRKKLKMA